MKFENEIPTIEEIGARFRDATGLELVSDPYGMNLYALSSPVLRGDIELELASMVHLVRFGWILGYFEWNVLRALHLLGARTGVRRFPRYAGVPWADLPWYSRWLHGRPGHESRYPEARLRPPRKR